MHLFIYMGSGNGPDQSSGDRHALMHYKTVSDMVINSRVDSGMHTIFNTGVEECQQMYAAALKGELGMITSKEIMTLALTYAGKLAKFGA